MKITEHKPLPIFGMPFNQFLVQIKAWTLLGRRQLNFFFESYVYVYG